MRDPTAWARSSTALARAPIRHTTTGAGRGASGASGSRITRRTTPATFERLGDRFRAISQRRATAVVGPERVNRHLCRSCGRPGSDIPACRRRPARPARVRAHDQSVRVRCLWPLTEIARQQCQEVFTATRLPELSPWPAPLPALQFFPAASSPTRPRPNSGQSADSARTRVELVT